MIYEVRMSVSFWDSEDRLEGSVTLIDHVEASDAAKAFNIANERKHDHAVEISKGEEILWNRRALGSPSGRIVVSLLAVVAKPHLSRDMKMGKFWSEEKLQNLYAALNAAYDKLNHCDEKTRLAWWVITLQNAVKI